MTLFAGVSAHAGVPDSIASDCAVVITQSPIRTRCFENFEPDVVRLCPVGTTETPLFDRVRFDLVVRDAGGVPCAGVVVEPVELAASVNIAEGGATTAITDAGGSASITLNAASGYGLVGICAESVILRLIEVRSPDAVGGPRASQCPLPVALASFVSFADYANPACGFIVNYGSVTPGVNNGWDLNCDGAVNGFDLFGVAGVGGLSQHFGHGGSLGSQAACP